MKLKEIKEYIEKNGIMSYLKRKNPEEARAFTVVQDSEKKQNRFINGKPRMNLINMTENNITSISPNMNVTRGEITVENAVEDRVEKNPDIVQNNAMKMQKLQELLTNAISHVVEENTKTMYKTVSEDVKQVVLKELDYQFRQNEERFQNWENSRLEREKQRMEREEEHYKKLDDLLRSYGKNKGSRKEKKPQE